MINVVHVNDKLSMDGRNPSSVARLLGDLLPRLHRYGVACSVCTLRDPDPGARYLEERDIVVRRFSFGKLSPRNLSAIAHLLREEDAAIAHLHGFGAADLGRVVTRRLGIVNVVHEHAILNMPLHQRLADRMLSGWTDAAIAVSTSVREFMIRDRSIPAECIKVIGNGVELDRFKAPGRGAVTAAREALGIPDDHSVVGVVTRLRREKGTEFLVRAVPRILDQISTVSFLIVGDGPLRASLEALTKEIGVDRHVHFLGFRDDVPLLLAVADVLVIPSLTEGFSLSLVEGMAAGRPIVATQVGGMLEIARDGDSVLFVPPEDSEAIFRATARLLTDLGLAGALGRRAVEVAARYGISASARSLAELYASLVGRGTRVGG